MQNSLTVEPNDEIKDRLRIAADKAGSLKALSKIAEIPYPSLMRHLRGEAEPKREALANMVDRLKIDGTWLLTGKGNPNAASGNQESAKKDTISIPKFCPKLFRETVENADDFETRGMLMASAYSSFYRKETVELDKKIVERLLGTVSLDIVAFDYDDNRTNSAPIHLFIDLADWSFRQGEEALIISNSAFYVVEAKEEPQNRNLKFCDISPNNPISAFTIEDLMRAEALVGKIVGKIFKNK